MENEEKIVTPRDYTFIELRREARRRSWRMFWVGVLLGIALCILVAFTLGIRIGSITSQCRQHLRRRLFFHTATTEQNYIRNLKFLLLNS
ncbi:MAG: hypothetical protein IJ724_14565 [Muribaculaceae bacterium]|nr:hypothetical protein [Muribaculaceae bacterium]MBR1727835.1 hypothetical protein [Muribaculaceae bacterium]